MDVKVELTFHVIRNVTQVNNSVSALVDGHPYQPDVDTKQQRNFYIGVLEIAGF